MIFNYPGFLWRLRSVVGVLVIVVTCAIWGTFTLISALMGASRERISWFLRSWTVFAAKAAGIRYEVEGREHDRPGEPCLIVSNHQSLFDIPGAYFSLGGPIRMVAKAELFRIPIFGVAIRAAGFIPIERGNRGSGAEATRLIGDRIRSGLQVWIAPEGTRSPDGRLQDFKKGSFGVALDQQIPVQPILLMDSWRACPKGSLLPRPGTVIRVKVLPRIMPADFGTVKDRGLLAAKVRAIMAEVYDRG